LTGNVLLRTAEGPRGAAVSDQLNRLRWHWIVTLAAPKTLAATRFDEAVRPEG
jgi:hypothetical protein